LKTFFSFFRRDLGHAQSGQQQDNANGGSQSQRFTACGFRRDDDFFSFGIAHVR
jgi:hypothetical protein